MIKKTLHLSLLIISLSSFAKAAEPEHCQNIREGFFNEVQSYLDTIDNISDPTQRDRLLNEFLTRTKPALIDSTNANLQSSGCRPIDTTPPTVQITAPNNGAYVSKTVNITASAADNFEIANVRFLVDNVELGEDESSPYSQSWNTLAISEGSYTLEVLANDFDGNRTRSNPVVVTVDNTAPVITNIQINAGSDQATITWNTVGDPSTSIVNYSQDPNTSLGSTKSDNTVTANHSLVITGLKEKTLYHYRLRSVDRAGNEGLSAVATFTTGEDSTSPTVQITAPGNGARVRDIVTIRGTASDNTGVAGVQFKVNGTNQGPEDTTADYSQTWDTSGLGDGTSHTLTAVARDLSNNLTTSAGVTVTIDRTAPTISNIQVTNIQTTRFTVTWQTNESATSQTNYGLTAGYGSQTTKTSTRQTAHSVTINGLAGNTLYHFRVRSVDEAGNEAISGDQTATTLPDSAAPSVQITFPNNGARVGGTISITATATDNTGVAGVQFRVNGVNAGAEDTSSPYSHSWNTTALSDESVQTLTAVARDSSNNQGTSAAVQVTIDNTAPIITGVQISEITGNSALITWTTSGDPSNSVVQYGPTAAYGSQKSDNPLVTSHSVRLTGLNDLTLYHFRVRSTDEAGNQGTSGDFTFTTLQTPDTTAPTVNFINPNDGDSVRDLVNVQVNATDNKDVTSVSLTINGTDQGILTSTPYNWAWDTSLYGEGPHTLQAEAVDAANNQKTVSISVNVDRTVPVIANIEVINIQQDRATVRITTNENTVSQVEYGLDASYGSQTTLTASYQLVTNVPLTSLSPNTEYHFRVKVQDKAGNQTVSGDLTFRTVDPNNTDTIIFLNPHNGDSFNGGTINVEVDVVGTFEENRVLISLDGSPLGSEMTSSPYRVPLNIDNLEERAYTLKAEAWDASNSHIQNSITITVDRTPPEFEQIFVIARTTYVVVTWITNEPATSQVEYGLESYDENITPRFPNNDRTHEVRIEDLFHGTTYFYRLRSVDRAGNEGITDVLKFATLFDPNGPVQIEDLAGYGFLKFKNVFYPLREEYIDILFKVPTGANVELSLYDRLGHEVYKLLENVPDPGGQVRWYGKSENNKSTGDNVGAGVYILILRADGVKDTAKIVVIK